VTSSFTPGALPTHFELQDLSPEEMASVYVERILNEHRIDVVPVLFANTYVDRNPMFGLSGGIEDLKWSVRFLAAPTTDFHFTLEDVMSTDQAIAYRLFGQGTFTLGILGTYLASGSARRDVMEPWMHQRGESATVTEDPTYKAMARTRSDRAVISLTVETVGWFRLRGRRIVERRGPYMLSW
jgi:hypothetical protein